MTHYGLPYFLEDKTGSLAGSDFVDIHDRMRLSVRCTARDAHRCAFMIYNMNPSVGGLLKPCAVLDFGPNNTLGTVAIGSGCHIPMTRYLTKVSPLGSSRTRKFIASDGQEYRWNWRARDNCEWVCQNGKNYMVACYNLKLPEEPPYSGSSGCMLTIEEAYCHLAVEFLASLMIMRYIAAYDL
ncbi:hypothetical protein GLOTRDRAFT_38358 [Gloeophyllum trabeum ATCC 11539]|uniref:Uncharacterized protein n=1 Tax=Gloeophyllum trabeum (strain ATCC 11539 / FP-39264 / Madison 617) TaxID=670483 RepID=S7QBX6_GLOTA|nr:uncharacterized protein GLOTRDRAFT_38358 [Gloeophyllum trabeum ATCC 11539]EPQ56858.1 hypothetical protein GLOTRDRAFT_38358 [Gloeophyllum trabeum ATCC 11539]